MNHPLFEIVTTTTGALSIRNKVVGEIMHNPVGPWAEANSLYIAQSNLECRLQGPGSDEFVVFDVGLGAGTNALAAIHCAQSLSDRTRPLKIVSFEKDLSLIEYALDHADKFSFFRGYEQAIKELLSHGFWRHQSISWELRHGDFVSTIEHETLQSHLVFYDPYSPKVNQDMWTTAIFKKLKETSAEPDQGGSLVITYSRATRIRVALIAAGFYVGYGKATGLKEETTQASTDRKLLSRPLDQAWLKRWSRSHLRSPFDCQPEEVSAIDLLVKSHFCD